MTPTEQAADRVKALVESLSRISRALVGAHDAWAVTLLEGADALTALQERVGELEGERDRLKEGLKFYQDEWEFFAVGDEPDLVFGGGGITGYEAEPTTALKDDGGNKARLLLQLNGTTPGERPCTCHPDDDRPTPCARRYALSECQAVALLTPPLEQE